MTDHNVAEAQQAEKLLSDLRQALLRLHKMLLDWERARIRADPRPPDRATIS